VSDPLQLVWDALAAHGYRPRGKPHDFRARCPGHDGRNPTSLHVRLGADGRAVLFCFAHQCPADTITAAVGLTVADLFPPGHREARRHASLLLRTADFAGVARSFANVLYALEQAGEPWQGMLMFRCPACGHPGAWLRASHRAALGNGHVPPGGQIDADCPEGCDADAIAQALRARLRAGTR
jgi:hypothetical protein